MISKPAHKLILGSLLIVSLLAVFPHASFAKSKKKKKSKVVTNWSPSKVKKYIREVFKDVSKKEQDKVIAVFTSESGLNCKAVSKTKDVGVAQINSIHWKRFGGKEKLMGCAENIRAAHTIYKEWGNSLRPWTNYKNGRYKAFL